MAKINRTIRTKEFRQSIVNKFLQAKEQNPYPKINKKLLKLIFSNHAYERTFKKNFKKACTHGLKLKT